MDTGESAGPGCLDTSCPSAVAFAPDGPTLACANLEYRWVGPVDLNGLKARARLESHRFWIAALAFSPDGKTLVSGGNNLTVKLWDVTTAREKAEFSPTVRSPMPLALSPDGTAVAIGGECGTIEVRKLASGGRRNYGHVGRVNSIAFSPDGRTLASAGDDGTVKLWDLTQEQNLMPLQGRQTFVWSVAYSPDGKLLAAAGDGDPELWDVPSGRLMCTIPGLGDGTAAVFTPNGKVLAGGSWLWDVGAARELPSFHKGGLAAAFSPDGEILAIGGKEDKNTVTLWHWRTGQKRATLSGHSQWVFSLAVSPDGLTLASASAQGTHRGEVILWEMASGRRKRTLEHGCACVAFSPDGKTLASGSKSGGIALWNSDTGKLLKDLVGHVSFMEDMAFAPDGKTIVACNVQGGVTLWDVEKGIERATLAKIGHSVYATAISPDGQTFATGGREGTLEIWRAASEAEVQAQSDCFDARLRLAHKYRAEARSLAAGLRLHDALRAYSQAEDLYAKLASEFPERTDYRYARLANQINLVALVANDDTLLAETNRWLKLANEVVVAICRDTNHLSALLRPALLNRFTLLQYLSRRAVTRGSESKPVPADAAFADVPVTCSNECERALVVIRRTLGAEHLETLRALRDLAVACETRGDFAQARKLTEAALAGLRRVLGPDHPETVRTMRKLAALYEKDNQAAQARELTAEVSRVLGRVFGRGHPAELESSAEIYLEQGRLAEIKELYRGVPPDRRGPIWARLCEPLQANLQRGRAACLAKSWQAAAASFHEALQQPIFDWDVANHYLPTPDHWIALAFVRSGDFEGHLRACKQFATVERIPVDPARGVLHTMLLPANPTPELLTLASNALPKSESVFTSEYELAWFRFHRSLLEYRSGRYADALTSARQAAEWGGKFCRVHSLIIQSMACQRLGQETEARRLWQQAAHSIAELRKEPKHLINVCNLLLIELLFEEAGGLLGLDGQKSLEQEAGALRNVPAP